MRLLLFDIDGTLIRSKGTGRLAMEAALLELFGTAGPIESYRMSGKLDSQIITDLLLSAGLQKAEIKAKLPLIYAKMAEKGKHIFWQKEMAACPGVEQLIPRLRLQSDVILGLLTGNTQLVAPLKLQAAGVNPSHFRLGVYGSDAMMRNDLPAIAYERAKILTGQPVDGKNTVIIGDTPADIVCARAGKATAVAVASGWHSNQTLAQYQPDYLFEDLKDIDAVVDTLLNG